MYNPSTGMYETAYEEPEITTNVNSTSGAKKLLLFHNGTITAIRYASLCGNGGRLFTFVHVTNISNRNT